MIEYLGMARDLGGSSHRSLNLSTGLHAGDVRRVWKKENKSQTGKDWNFSIIELTFNIELDLPWSRDSQLVVSGASVDPSALPPSRGDQHLFLLLSILDVLVSDLLLRAPNTLASCAPPSHPARGVAVRSEEVFGGSFF